MAGGEMAREGSPVDAHGLETHRLETDGVETRGVTGHGVTLVAATSMILGTPLHVQEDEQVLVPFTRHNDVVVVPGGRARELVSRLERAGIDGDRISFLRLDPASVGERADATPSPRLDVGPIGQPEERSVVMSAVLGGIIGAAVVGLVVLAIADAGAAVWGAIGGLLLGGAIGGLWGAFSRIGASDAWERSLHLASGERAAVGVHLDDPAGNDGVTEILSPFGLWVFASDGSVVRRPDRGEAQRDR